MYYVYGYMCICIFIVYAMNIQLVKRYMGGCAGYIAVQADKSSRGYNVFVKSPADHFPPLSTNL